MSTWATESQLVPLLSPTPGKCCTTRKYTPIQWRSSLRAFSVRIRSLILARSLSGSVVGMQYHRYISLYKEIHTVIKHRICPGQHLADASVWLACAMSLAVFDVSPVSGEELPKPEMTDGTISHPVPFRCSITPRSAQARELVLSVEFADDA
jgi:hypothetical protein